MYLKTYVPKQPLWVVCEKVSYRVFENQKMELFLLDP